MATKSYYVILGVSPRETPRGIRAAYRDLAKRLHPDVAGEDGTRAFQEVSEAYDVLSNPQRRRNYNEALRREDGDVPALRRPPPQPPPTHEPITILDDPDSIHPSFDALYARLLRNFAGIAIPKSEHAEALNVELLLTPEEASSGCILPIGVPVFLRCPHCGGAGRTWGFPCTACDRGVLEVEQTAGVRIPPVPSCGSTFDLRLGDLGISNFYLRLHVLVDR
jgi:molecular chaperone DnaJ